jgi:hypothetical protein
MDVFLEPVPEIIRAAAMTGLGAFALLALILGFIAWRFFRDAPHGWRFAAFVLLFMGVAGFAAALFLQPPALIEGVDARASQRSTDVRAQN